MFSFADQCSDKNKSPKTDKSIKSSSSQLKHSPNEEAKCKADKDEDVKNVKSSKKSTKHMSKELEAKESLHKDLSNESSKESSGRQSKKKKASIDSKEVQTKELTKESSKIIREMMKDPIKATTKQPAKQSIKQSAKETAKQVAKQHSTPANEAGIKQSTENVNEEDEVLISNKTKLIEKKLIEEMQNQSSRDKSPNLSSAASKSSANIKLNPYKNGYISAYFENNRQKSFNRPLYTQNSFDSGFYSPSSNDSYNLSSTSGSCNVIYSTSGSEQNTLNTNKDLNSKPDYASTKDSSMYSDAIDSIDPLPTSFKIATRNLPRNIACFNGSGFAYWSANNYRKYYSTEILSDWN